MFLLVYMIIYKGLFDIEVIKFGFDYNVVYYWGDLYY